MLGFVPLAIAGGALLVNPAIDGAWRSGRITVRDIANYRKFLDENRANEAKARSGGRAAEVREIRKHRTVIEQRVKDALAFTQAGRAGRVRVLPLHRANLNTIYPHLLSLSASIDAANRPTALVSRGLQPVARGLTKPQLFAAWRVARTPAQRAEILRKLYVFHRVTPAELQSQGIVPTPVTLTPTAFTASTPAFVSSAPAFVPASSTAPPGAAASTEAAAAPAFTPSTETPAFVSSETPAEAPSTNWLLIGGVAAAVGILYVMSKKKKASVA